MDELGFWAKHLYTGVGVLLLYSRLGRRQLRTVLLGQLLDTFGLSRRTRLLLELALFVIIGSIVGIAAFDPRNEQQCLAAGFGWTGFLAKPAKNGESTTQKDA